MSAKRPSRRYIGFRFEPPGASRREVGSAVEAAVRKGVNHVLAPRLLVCEGGVGIVVVPTPHAAPTREALAGAGVHAGLRLTPVVSSGTIAAVKRKMRVTGDGARAPR